MIVGPPPTGGRHLALGSGDDHGAADLGYHYVIITGMVGDDFIINDTIGLNGHGERVLVSAEPAEVVTELGQAVVGVGGEALPVEQPRQDVTGGPVGHEAAGMEQDVEQAEHAIIVQVEARHSTVPRVHGQGEADQLALVEGAGQQLGRASRKRWLVVAIRSTSAGTCSGRRPTT